MIIARLNFSMDLDCPILHCLKCNFDGVILCTIYIFSTKYRKIKTFYRMCLLKMNLKIWISNDISICVTILGKQNESSNNDIAKNCVMLFKVTNYKKFIDKYLSNFFIYWTFNFAILLVKPHSLHCSLSYKHHYGRH
jgi:hypothetical protein